MNNLTPEVKNEIRAYFEGGGNDAALSILYTKVFNGTLNNRCGTCVQDAKQALYKIINPKAPKIMAGKYKWTSNPSYQGATVNLKQPNGAVVVTKENLTDAYAQVIAGIPKYAHLVELTDPEFKLPALERPNVSQASISTEAVTPKDEPQPKPKKQKHKYK